METDSLNRHWRAAGVRHVLLKRQAHAPETRAAIAGVVAKTGFVRQALLARPKRSRSSFYTMQSADISDDAIVGIERKSDQTELSHAAHSA
jgi:hypothetical protein